MLHWSCIWRPKRELNPVRCFIRALLNQSAIRNYIKSSQKIFEKNGVILQSQPHFLLLWLVTPTTTSIVGGSRVMMTSIILVIFSAPRSFVNLAVDVLNRLFEASHRLTNLRNVNTVAHKVAPYVKIKGKLVLSIINIYRHLFYNGLCGIYINRTLWVNQFIY